MSSGDIWLAHLILELARLHHRMKEDEHKLINPLRCQLCHGCGSIEDIISESIAETAQAIYGVEAGIRQSI